MSCSEPPITKIKDLVWNVWPDAKGELELFRQDADETLEFVLMPPVSLDFMTGPPLYMLLSITERTSDPHLIDYFLKPFLDTRLRFHYALRRYLKTENVVSSIETILDLSFSARMRAWGLRRYSRTDVQGYNILFTSLRDEKTPAFKT